MKLARANLFLVVNNSQLALRRRARPNSSQRSVQHVRRRLVAGWHLCPQTQRLDCRWVEPEISESQLRSFQRLRRAACHISVIGCCDFGVVRGSRPRRRDFTPSGRPQIFNVRPRHE